MQYYIERGRAEVGHGKSPLQRQNTVQGVQGFGNILEDIENELKPWDTDLPEYDGTWADGLMHGNGRLVYPNGDIYKGGF